MLILKKIDLEKKISNTNEIINKYIDKVDKLIFIPCFGMVLSYAYASFFFFLLIKMLGSFLFENDYSFITFSLSIYFFFTLSYFLKNIYKFLFYWNKVEKLRKELYKLEDELKSLGIYENFQEFYLNLIDLKLEDKLYLVDNFYIKEIIKFKKNEDQNFDPKSEFRRIYKNNKLELIKKNSLVYNF